jgi:iron(III) transport system ATP-binding protein
VSFAVEPGEFISLLGPSGCGKTTTLRCIAGFERPDGGRILVDGQPVTDAAAGIFVAPNRRRFGMVFQSYAIWPHMTVLDNVGYPLKVGGGMSRAQLRERVQEQLRVVGLSGLEERYPAQLSGGQQQRVALARALVMEPSLLLFDEPLSNLDAKLRERMRFELIEIQSRLGIPAVYVTHDQAEAMVMSRRVIVMDGGHIAQSGPPEEVYETPQSRFVADFIGLSNFIEGSVVGAAGEGCWRVESVLGQHGAVGGAHEVGQRVLLAVRPEHIQLSDVPLRGDGAFRAELRNRYFVGPYCEYFIAVGDVILRAQRAERLSVKEGQPVFAQIAVERCRIVEGGSRTTQGGEMPPEVRDQPQARRHG